MEQWTVRRSRELYNIEAWGGGYFHINEAGEVVVTPQGPEGPSLSLAALVRDLSRRGLEPPLLVRLSDVLRDRLRSLVAAFERAGREMGFRGSYRPVYPIKVNQHRHVVEELVAAGRPYHLGLEAGSKPELVLALALLDDPEAVIVCNGYKDEEYIEIALLGQKLGRQAILVVDRARELEGILRVARRLGVKPRLGVRARLHTRTAGKWADSTGARAKFGLTAAELVGAVDRLRRADLLESLVLFHFHLGSQIPAIQPIKEALREGVRLYVELRRLGAPLPYLDVGGGLAVDYDGSATAFPSSANYTVQEYANDVAYAAAEACNQAGLSHPVLLSESGRALVAHHAFLAVEILDTDPYIGGPPPSPPPPGAPAIVRDMWEIYTNVNPKNLQESFHDALAARDEGMALFKLGYLDLPSRAHLEALFRASVSRLLACLKELDEVPEELTDLETKVADTYFANFSLFRSVPDHWAMKQLFPVMPLCRLGEEPRRRAVLADLTCDSDGRMDRFIDRRTVKKTLEVHAPRPGEPYILGIFLVGAYQEILGDLHNLFGLTNAVQVSLEEDGGYRIDHVVEGETVAEVLANVEYDAQELVQRLRRSAEAAGRAGRLTLEEIGQFLDAYRSALRGYTYLEHAPPALWQPKAPLVAEGA